MDNNENLGIRKDQPKVEEEAPKVHRNPAKNAGTSKSADKAKTPIYKK